MQKLDWGKLLSSDRYEAIKFEETDFDARSEFQRDIDRIVFCSAFRRLQDKTQVMPLPQSDYVRSRLTHSIEVASMGRALGNLVGKYVIEKENLPISLITKDDFGNMVSASCLAHDIGNPPFGHTGEKAIGNFFRNFFIKTPDFKNQILAEENGEAKILDLENFEGNAAGLRILANDHPSGRTGGLRLTYATYGSFTKYPKGSSKTAFNDLGISTSGRKSQSKFGFFQTEKEVFSKIAEELGLLPLSIKDSLAPAWCRHPLSFLMEAADSLTYSIIDIEDGHKVGHINSEDAEDLLYSIVKETTDPRCNIEDWKSIKEPDERIGALRSKALSSLLYECYGVFKDNYEGIMAGKFDKELPDIIKSKEYLENIKKMSFDNYLSHSSVIDVELAGFEVLGGLLELFTNVIIEYENKKEIKDARNRRLLLKMSKHFSSKLNSDSYSIYEKLLICADYLSRMTDGFAMKLYKKLKGIEL